MDDPRRVEPHLGAIYATPNHDGPRRVFADALVERGESRGAFIHMQLDRGVIGAPSREESNLLRGNERRWLDALAICALDRGHIYERGFATRVALNDLAPRLADHPAWSLVNELDVTAVHPDVPLEQLFAEGAARHVSVLRGADARVFARLSGARGVIPLVDVIDLRYSHPRDVVDGFGRLACATHLRHVGLTPNGEPWHPHELGALVRTDGMAHVNELSVPIRSREERFEAMCDILGPAPLSLHAVTLVMPEGNAWRLTRSPSGSWTPSSYGPSYLEPPPMQVVVAAPPAPADERGNLGKQPKPQVTPPDDDDPLGLDPLIDENLIARFAELDRKADSDPEG